MIKIIDDPEPGHQDTKKGEKEIPSSPLGRLAVGVLAFGQASLGVIALGQAGIGEAGKKIRG